MSNIHSLPWVVYMPMWMPLNSKKCRSHLGPSFQLQVSSLGPHNKVEKFKPDTILLGKNVLHHIIWGSPSLPPPPPTITLAIPGLLTEKHLADKHITDRHRYSGEKYLANRHLADKHITDIHLVNRHLENRHSENRHLAGRHLVREYKRRLSTTEHLNKVACFVSKDK